MERVRNYMPVWGRYVDMLDKLGDAELGALFRGMLHYYFDDAEPELSGAVGIYWGFLRQDLDHARESYDKKVENGRKAGQRSGEIRRAKAAAKGTETNQNEANGTKMNQVEPNRSNRNQNEQIKAESESESKAESESKTESKKETEADDCFAPAEAGVSVEKRAYGEFGWVRLTDSQYRTLQAQMGEQALQDCIRYMDRSAQATGNRHRWRDWQVMIRRCYEEGWYQSGSRSMTHSKTIPKGASGELGEAELEAIRRVLAQDFPDLPPLRQDPPEP